METVCVTLCNWQFKVILELGCDWIISVRWLSDHNNLELRIELWFVGRETAESMVIEFSSLFWLAPRIRTRYCVKKVIEVIK